jgi:hypothetical protein
MLDCYFSISAVIVVSFGIAASFGNVLNDFNLGWPLCMG